MNITSLQVGPIGTNCYLVEEDGLCAVIDPGGECPVICRELDRRGWKPAAILLTHSHFDHTGGVDDLRAAYPGLPVYRSSRDDYHDPQALQIFPLLTDTLSCDEGDEIPVGKLTFTVLATPGHSEGSLTFRCGDALFCGDTLFAGSCGRTDFLGGDQRKMLASLRRLSLLPGNLTVYPGHMEPSTLDRERAENPYMLHAMRGIG